MTDTWFNRLTGVLVAPAATFQRIAERPGWIAPLVVTIVAALAVTPLLLPKLDFEQAIREQLTKSGTELSAAELESQVAVVTKFATVTAWVGPFVMTPALFALLALILWGTVSLAGGQLRYLQSLAVVSHAWLPQVVASLLSVPVILSRDTIDANDAQGGHLLTSHLGALVERADSPVVYAMLSSFDVFTFWSLALLTLGLSIAGRIKRSAAAVAVLGPWVVWVLGKAGMAALPALLRS